jgi:trimeric autotransporter adhesin
VSSIGGKVGWTTLSDGRYKVNVKEDVPGLDFITKLRPVTYTLDVSAIENRLMTRERIPTGSPEVAEALARPQLSPEEQRANAEKAKVVYTGFVAQEVEEVARKLNYDFSGVDLPKNKEDFYGLRYGEFVVPLVKAVQELSEENKQLQENNELLRKEMIELKAMVTKLLNGQSNNASGDNNTMTNLSGAYLEQNRPNPFNDITVLRYSLPEGTTAAKIEITGINGQLLKSIALTGSGKGQVTLTANTLAKGVYTCTLWVNNQRADSKQMLLK